MIHIESLQPNDWMIVLERALLRVPEAHRPDRVQHCLRLLESGVLDPRGIFVGRRNGDIIGVQICAPLAGRSCLFWLPGTDDEVADKLVDAGLAWARSIGCKLTQALVHPDETPYAEPLKRCGFAVVTRLYHLERNFDDVPISSATLHLESYRPALHADFAATLERSYEGTLDCPELNGRRTADEILAGHRGQGTFHPECWWLAYDGTRPVGILLLVEMPDGVTWELAYLGIVLEHRRHGLGRALTLHALHALRNQPAMRIFLCVDERNDPARELYRSLGFTEVEWSDVLLCFI